MPLISETHDFLGEQITVSDKISHVSEADFESEVLNSDVPVLVDYWASGVVPAR